MMILRLEIRTQRHTVMENTKCFLAPKAVAVDWQTCNEQRLVYVSCSMMYQF